MLDGMAADGSEIPRTMMSHLEGGRFKRSGGYWQCRSGWGLWVIGYVSLYERALAHRRVLPEAEYVPGVYLVEFTCDHSSSLLYVASQIK